MHASDLLRDMSSSTGFGCLSTILYFAAQPDLSSHVKHFQSRNADRKVFTVICRAASLALVKLKINVYESRKPLLWLVCPMNASPWSRTKYHAIMCRAHTHDNPDYSCDLSGKGAALSMMVRGSDNGAMYKGI